MPLGVTVKILRLDAIGYMLTDIVTNSVPICVDALHPLNLTIIQGSC